MPAPPKNNLPNYPLFESPLFEQFLPELGWGPDFTAVARGLRDNGFAVVDFPHGDFDDLAEGIIARLSEQFDDMGSLSNGARIQDAWQSDEAVKEIACNGAIMNLLRTVYGRKVFPFQTLNFPIGTEQHFHSDAVHFNSRPERFMCGVWVALEDIDEDNGPLLYYRGSHTWPIYTTDQLGVNFAGLEKEPEQALYEPLWEDLVAASGIEPQTFHAKKGQCLIWAANLLHGGMPHLDKSRTRWSQVTHYYFEDCSYWVPLGSNSGMGHMQYKRPFNILTGERVENTYLGQRVISTKNRPSNQPVKEADFDAAGYLQRNPDVAAEQGADPQRAYLHYLEHGFYENRHWKTSG